MSEATPLGWICDTCGEIIESPKDGYVQWVVFRDEDGQRRARDLNIVHHKTTSPLGSDAACYLDATGGSLMDNDLESFLSQNGLMQLLSMLDEGLLPKEQVIEVIKRLHIKGYEHARFHFDKAIAAGVFEPNTRPGFYLTSQIQAVLQWRRRREVE